MKPLIILDFDGVLFDSVTEVYQVCEHLAKDDSLLRDGLLFDEFLAFRSQLTDAWQFSRLYQKNRILHDITYLPQVVPDDEDWAFADKFFSTRAELIKDLNWAKRMSPYSFFYQLRPFLLDYPDKFKILSTRNRESIERTLEFFDVSGIEIFSQKDIREHGSKVEVVKHLGLLHSGNYVIYIDDMKSHLEPFESTIDICIHAGWGYGDTQEGSYTQEQAFNIVSAVLNLSKE